MESAVCPKVRVLAKPRFGFRTSYPAVCDCYPLASNIPRSNIYIPWGYAGPESTCNSGIRCHGLRHLSFRVGKCLPLILNAPSPLTMNVAQRYRPSYIYIYIHEDTYIYIYMFVCLSIYSFVYIRGFILRGLGVLSIRGRISSQSRLSRVQGESIPKMKNAKKMQDAFNWPQEPSDWFGCFSPSM